MSLFQHKPHLHVVRNVNDLHEGQMSTGAKIADIVANAIGSWAFIIVQACIMAIWIIVNVLVVVLRFDAYPFVFLNLAMSAEAAFSAPVIMMAQNRQSAKDRITAEETYKDTQKNEEEIRAVMEHLTVQDAELLKQTAELLRQTQMLEDQSTRVEKLLKRIDAATGRGVA